MRPSHFRTELLISFQTDFEVKHTSKLACAGSCFAQYQHKWLKNHKFQAAENLTGIVFNPVALARLYTEIPKNMLGDTWLAQRDGLWFHYLFHSSIHATSQEQLLTNVQQRAKKLQADLAQTHYLILTLGTAWVYELPDAETVANCHKQPQQLFTKRLLSVDEVTKAVKSILTAYPSLKIILTVSPVIHIKDTLELNGVSKSVLRLAAHRLQEAYPKRVSYFPSYEIIKDDLRDYRFYAQDMLHPSKQARQYVQQKFSEAYFSGVTKELVERWQKMEQRLAHKPLNPSSEQHKAFVEKTKNLLRQLPFDTEAEQEQIYR